MQFLIFLYFALLGFILALNSTLALVLWFLSGVLILSLIPVFQKIKTENLKKQIKNNTAKININKASWRELELLDGFTRLSAKRAIWIRSHLGFYSSIDDFFEKNQIKNREEIEHFIFI